jgi:multicomponent Na+:H+ antiporter subunit D
MTAEMLPPALIFICGAALVPFLNGQWKSAYMLLLPVVAFSILLVIPEQNIWLQEFWGIELILGRIDKLSLVFGYIFIIMAFLGILFALQVKDNLQHVAALVYAGSTLGVVFAGDFLSLYIFWELMAISSVFIVIAPRTAQAVAAGYRYILVHIVGGLLLLGGIIFYVQDTGSLQFDYIGLSGAGSWLIFLGIAVNAAAIPFHAWLPDAYPESTSTGSVFLSAFTTKSAVYLMARTFPGTEILIWIGAIMVTVPIFYAVLENDIRRVLAYSLLNQVGFMLCGIGIGTHLALNGAVSHAFCHIIYKALLFMSAGSVLYMTGRSKCTDLGGLYKTMPLTALFCMVGAASISAFPLFSGFVSKSMVVSASSHHHMVVIWLVLQFASAGVFHHAGIKVPYFTFFGHDSGVRSQDPPWNMVLAMGIASLICLVIGVYPEPLYAVLPYPVDYVPYTAAHVVGQLQLLMFGALAFCLLILSGFYPPEIRALNLDVDWFYRKGGRAAYLVLDKGLNGLNAGAHRVMQGVVGVMGSLIRDAMAKLVLFVLVNFWLLTGVSGKRLELKKTRAYYDVMQGTMPVGLGACVATFFIILIYMLS